MFFIIKVAAGSGSSDDYFRCSLASGIDCSVQKMPPAETPAASKTQNRSFGGVFQLLIYSFISSASYFAH